MSWDLSKQRCNCTIFACPIAKDASSRTMFRRAIVIGGNSSPLATISSSTVFFRSAVADLEWEFACLTTMADDASLPKSEACSPSGRPRYRLIGCLVATVLKLLKQYAPPGTQVAADSKDLSVDCLNGRVSLPSHA